MADKNTSSSSAQMPSANALTQQAFDAWKKVVDDQIARMGSVYGEMAKMEGRGIEQMRTAVDEYSKMVKESLSYTMQYTAEWRRITLEGARRAAELMTPRA
jgi:hypothetical protein